MNALIAQIVKYLIDLLTTAINNFKLKKLTSNYEEKKEISDEKTNSVLQSYDQFMDDYHDWLERDGGDVSAEARRVQQTNKKSGRQLSKTAGDNKRTTGNNKRTGRRNRGAKKTTKRGKGQQKGSV